MVWKWVREYRVEGGILGRGGVVSNSKYLACYAIPPPKVAGAGCFHCHIDRRLKGCVRVGLHSRLDLFGRIHLLEAVYLEVMPGRLGLSVSSPYRIPYFEVFVGTLKMRGAFEGLVLREELLLWSLVRMEFVDFL